MRVIFVILFASLLIGCSANYRANELSLDFKSAHYCQKQMAPNSLEFLEQQYHCKNGKQGE